MKNSQYGVGLIEVLVSLVLLGIAVLGYTALQVRAITASTEASQNVLATNIARDLSERIRMNRNGLAEYKSTTSQVDCKAKFCDATEMAHYDYAQVENRATALGMDLAILDCQGSTLTRKCIYVAWAQTKASNGDGDTHCTNGTSYVPDAQCIIMETYNYTAGSESE